MNWFFIPTPASGIQTPAITGTWPGSLTTTVQDTTTPITTQPRFVSITSLDSTHAVTTYRNGLSGTSAQMIMRPLEITGTSIVKGTAKLLQNGSSIGIIAETAAMTPTRFVTGMDNTTDRFFVGDLAFPTITDAHGSIQNAGMSLTRVFSLNANFFALGDINASTGSKARLFSLTGTTIAASGIIVSNTGALNIDRGAHSNGTYFSLIGDGVFAPNNQPRFTSYYFNGSSISIIADNLALTPDNGSGHAIHNLTNNLCAMAFRKTGNTTTQFISLYQSTPAGLNLIKTIEILYDDLIVNFFSEGNTLYALTAPNGGVGPTTTLGISSFTVSPTNITYAAKFTTATSINQISNPSQNELIKIDRLSVNKWIFEYVSELDGFLNYHIIAI